MNYFDDLEEHVETRLIDEVIAFEVSKAKERAVRRVNELHVTDLLYCSRKKKLLQKYPDMYAEIVKRPAVFHGKCFEKGLFDIVKKWAKSNGVKVRFWVKGRKRIIYNNMKYELIGEADIVVLSDMDKIDMVIEVKDKIWDLKPTEHYIIQAKMYGWLFDADKVLLWIFTNKGVRGYEEYKIDERFTDDDIAKYVDMHVSGKKVPMWSWECERCPFRSVCDKGVFV